MLHLSGLTLVAHGIGHALGKSHPLVDPFEQQHTAVGRLVRGGERSPSTGLSSNSLNKTLCCEFTIHVGLPYKNRPALPVQAIFKQRRASKDQIHE